MKDFMADFVMPNDEIIRDDYTHQTQFKMPMEDPMADFIWPYGDSEHDDDLHLDWRTQIDTPIDLPSGDDDDLSSVVSDPPTVGGFLDLDYRRPRELVETETIRNNQPLGSPKSHQVHEGYIKVLSSICFSTGTENACPHVRKGLPYAVFTAQSLTIDRMYESNDDIAI